MESMRKKGRQAVLPLLLAGVAIGMQLGCEALPGEPQASRETLEPEQGEPISESQVFAGEEGPPTPAIIAERERAIANGPLIDSNQSELLLGSQGIPNGILVENLPREVPFTNNCAGLSAHWVQIYDWRQCQNPGPCVHVLVSEMFSDADNIPCNWWHETTRCDMPPYWRDSHYNLCFGQIKGDTGESDRTINIGTSNNTNHWISIYASPNSEGGYTDWSGSSCGIRNGAVQDNVWVDGYRGWYSGPRLQESSGNACYCSRPC
jgi:hypothetical protein